MFKEISQYLIGNMSVAFLIAAFIFAHVGLTISLLISASKRDVSNPRTPDNFSWRFLIVDNIRRLLLVELLILVFLRFAPELLGMTLTMWIAFLVGLGFDRLAAFLKTKGLFQQ